MDLSLLPLLPPVQAGRSVPRTSHAASSTECRVGSTEPGPNRRPLIAHALHGRHLPPGGARGYNGTATGCTMSEHSL